MNKMLTEDIPAFVQDVIDAGCNIRCFDERHYVIGDNDLPPETRKRAALKLERICERYGSRDHLLQDIAQYLHAIGRIYRGPLH